MEESKVVFDIGSQIPYIVKRCCLLLALSFVFIILSMSPVAMIRGAYLYQYMSVMILFLLLLYGVLMAIGFKHRLRSVEYTPEGIKINDELYISDLDHGIGVNNKMTVSGRHDIGGMLLVVYAMDENCRRIKKTFWTGPRNNRYCAEKRAELGKLIHAGGTARRERELIKIRDEGKTMNVSFDMSEIKRKRYVRLGMGSAAFAALVAAGIILIAGGPGLAPISFFVFLAAAAVAYYTVREFAAFKTNMKTAAEKVTFDKDNLTVNGKTYEIRDGLNVDIQFIGAPRPAGIISIERPQKKTDRGYYLRIRDGQTEERYWMGDPLDGALSMVFSICFFILALKGQEEKG